MARIHCGGHVPGSLQWALILGQKSDAPRGHRATGSTRLGDSGLVFEGLQPAGLRSLKQRREAWPRQHHQLQRSPAPLKLSLDESLRPSSSASPWSMPGSTLAMAVREMSPGLAGFAHLDAVDQQKLVGKLCAPPG
ncbi:hypothetical protein FDECE_5215 [Fusarium decemcellulare]|nr:hypothetical protein FDECE_5215 [Fusarium decemcellulare]